MEGGTERRKDGAVGGLEPVAVVDPLPEALARVVPVTISTTTSASEEVQEYVSRERDVHQEKQEGLEQDRESERSNPRLLHDRCALPHPAARQ
jgi:hypothetical protein